MGWPVLAAEVVGWLAQVQAAAATEDAQHGADQRGDEMPDRVASKQQRLEHVPPLRRCKPRRKKNTRPLDQDGHGPSCGLQEHGKPQWRGGWRTGAQRSFTDPHSRILPTWVGFIQGYNLPKPARAAA
jgi:hypothetical protein